MKAPERKRPWMPRVTTNAAMGPATGTEPTQPKAKPSSRAINMVAG